MYNIKTLNPISPKGLNNFGENYSVDNNDEKVDAYLVRSAKMHDMEWQEDTLAVARAGAGVNNIPIEECAKKGVVVFNTPGANANAVKELAVMALLLSSRKVVQGIQWVSGQKDTEGLPALVEKQKSKFAGPEIKGKTLGVIGLGAIGVMVANTAKSLGMNVLGFDPFISVKSAWGLSRSVNHCSDFDQLLSTCDYISIHAPLTDSTKHMFNEESLAKVKKGVRLLNFSRGGLVCNKSLLKALDDERVSCYVTDFPDNELCDHPNILCIPHLGASTPESEENCAMMAVEQMKDYLENGNIKHSVNYPSCNMGVCADPCRLTVLHKNQPAMVGQITQILAEANININNMNNRSKGEFAYTVLDLQSILPEELVNNLESIDGVIRVRSII